MGQFRSPTVPSLHPRELSPVLLYGILLTYTLSVHMGKNELGNTFSESYMDFENNVVSPYHKFLREVYRTYNYHDLLF